MNPAPSGYQGSGPNSTAGMDRQGSVRRAREMLEAGRRPENRMPKPKPKPKAGQPPFRNDPSHMTQWPLPDDNLQSNVVDPHARLFVPKGPPPQRPPRPDLPSPSVYSERSGSVSDAAPSPLHITRPVPSFSQPLQRQPPLRPTIRAPVPPSPTSPEDPMPRISIATDDLFRQSTASSVGSIPSIPDFPFPAQPVSAEQQRKTSNLAPPPLMGRPGLNRQSSVSPIPEELSDSPTIKGSFASSMAIPSNRSSARPESDILETYLDGESDEEASIHSARDRGTSLVRQASLGKMSKPALRTIQKPTAESPLPPFQHPAATVSSENTSDNVIDGAALKETAVGHHDRRDSFSSTSTDSSHFDLEKAPIVLDMRHEHPAFNQPSHNMGGALQKEMGVFPKAGATMSDKRPGGRRPPRLDMTAVRDAEKRGSLTSLPDLIRRATKLASNLEHGRTASRNDQLDMGGPPKFPFGHQNRRSGSIKDILASFPPPAATPEGHSSWPAFLRKSTLHHLRSNETGPENGDEKAQKRPRRCCGMPLWMFLLVCAVIIIVILAAILIPVFLVVVPRHNSSSGSECERSSPCENGGVSVSSGDVCSCVCSNGYTGSQCTIAGDASCTTTEISSGSSSKNATMGNDLPRLFDNAQKNFSIPLDPITIMALFSQNNVSCTTENTLISFKSVSGGSKSRRALTLESELSSPEQSSDDSDSPTPSLLEAGTQTLAARGSVATENGIVFDTSKPTESVSIPTQTMLPPAAKTQGSHTTSSATPTASAVPTKVIDFSRIAVLYIFEKTGEFDAAMLSEERIQHYLSDSYPDSHSKDFTVDLSDSGVSSNYTLNFDGYKITSSSGTSVGGN